MKSETHDRTIASELGIASKQVATTVEFLDDGATVPFLARYRKEKTGGLDEVVITSIRDRVAQLRELDKRRAAILGSLEEQANLTDDLQSQIRAATSMTSRPAPGSRWTSASAIPSTSPCGSGASRASRPGTAPGAQADLDGISNVPQ